METKMVVVVKAIIQLENKYLILERDENDEHGASTWEFPGGKIEFGESLENALVREASEETGLWITVDKLLYATTFMSNPLRQVIVLAYLCNTLHDEIKLSREHSNYCWVYKSQLRENLDNGIVMDMDKYQIFDVLA